MGWISSVLIGVVARFPTFGSLIVTWVVLFVKRCHKILWPLVSKRVLAHKMYKHIIFGGKSGKGGRFSGDSVAGRVKICYTFRRISSKPTEYFGAVFRKKRRQILYFVGEAGE